ncbi:hypothetical protein [Alteromonas facilis]|uniref:hypothetical protein n=1 Tax=Alteromonas facilis TaxID=2048004 RepID=UPI000C28496B|nr:hypothetical protein [Alteromonas facilis]
MLNKTVFTIALWGSLALSSLAIATFASAETKEHKTIQVHAVKDENVRIVVDDAGNENVIVLTAEELADENLLEDKLAMLDSDTAETVRQAVEGTRHMFVDGFDFTGMKGNHEKVIVINEGVGEQVHAFAFGDSEFEIEYGNEEGVKRKHQIIINGDGTGVLTGHTDAVVRLIERGEFSQEELDKIQAAVDAKR